MNDPGFTLVQLRYFAATARLGSMTKAARELLVSQSAVSTAVAQLEKELGVQLLLRHHARGLTLTAVGEDFYRGVQAFLAHSIQLAESAQEAGRILQGRLTVGCFSTLGPIELPQILNRLEDEYPKIDVTILEAEHGALKAALRAGQCELALLYSYDLDDDIETATVGFAPPYVLVSPSHRLARRRSVRLAELATEPMVLLDLPHSRDYLRSVLTSVGITPDVRYRNAGFESVRTMVALGRGYTILNQRPAHDLTYDGRRVVPLKIADEVAPLEVVVSWMKGVRLTARARAFLQVARTASAPATSVRPPTSSLTRPGEPRRD